MLVAEISRKSLRLKYSQAREEANITLLNSDTNTLSYTVPTLHRIWARPLEIAVNIYILSTIVKEASALVIIPAAGKLLVPMSLLLTPFLESTMYSAERTLLAPYNV